MSLQLQPDQLLNALHRLDHPNAAICERMLFDLCETMADLIVKAVPEVEREAGKTNNWDGMVCTPLTAVDPTQPIPEALLGFDDGGWD